MHIQETMFSGIKNYWHDSIIPLWNSIFFHDSFYLPSEMRYEQNLDTVQSTNNEIIYNEKNGNNEKLVILNR